MVGLYNGYYQSFLFSVHNGCKILYRNIGNAPPEVRNMLRGNWQLQQDNDPKHTSRIVKEFLDKNVPEVMD